MTDIAPSGFATPKRLPSTAPSKRLRRVGFGVIAAFILLSPLPGQLLGKHSPWLREWVMYSGVGVGIPKGVFTLTDATGAELDKFTPLEAAGLERFPAITHYRFGSRVFAKSDMKRFASVLCADVLPGQRVSFDGVVGTRQGWQEMPIANVCAEEGTAQ